MPDVPPILTPCSPPAPCAGWTRRDDESDALDARFGPMPFSERLRIENERTQRARGELDRHAGEGRRADEPRQHTGRTAHPSLPRAEAAPRSAMLGPASRAETPAPARAVMIPVQTVAVRHGSMLDVFA